ncbi:MAG: mechanosensitive ion channel domain-containing protein [Candidatus Hadarchaeaceae archaeon]
MLKTQILTNFIVIFAIITFWAVLSSFFRRKPKRIVRHHGLSNSLSMIFTIVALLCLLNVWEIIQARMELFPAFTLSAVPLFSVNGVWMSNILAGISLIRNKSIRVRTEVEIEGEQGPVVELSLTMTKLKTHGGRRIIAPNRKFRGTVIGVKPKIKQR